MTTFLQKCALWAFRHPWWALLIIAAMATHGCASNPAITGYQAAVAQNEQGYADALARCPDFDTACRARADQTHRENEEGLRVQLQAYLQAQQIQSNYWAQMAPALGQSMGQFGQAIGNSVNPPLIVYPKQGGSSQCYPGVGGVQSCYW